MNLVTSESIDGTPSTEEAATATAATTNEDEEIEGEKAEDKKIVFIGSDVDRSWTQYFDVVEVMLNSIFSSHTSLL